MEWLRLDGRSDYRLVEVRTPGSPTARVEVIKEGKTRTAEVELPDTYLPEPMEDPVLALVSRGQAGEPALFATRGAVAGSVATLIAIPLEPRVSDSSEAKRRIYRVVAWHDFLPEPHLFEFNEDGRLLVVRVDTVVRLRLASEQEVRGRFGVLRGSEGRAESDRPSPGEGER